MNSYITQEHFSKIRIPFGAQNKYSIRKNELLLLGMKECGIE
jgi:hypothetical protein